MSERPDKLTEIKERVNCAAASSAIDEKLLETLARAGYDPGAIIDMIDRFNKGMTEGTMTCATVRNEIRRAFPKGRSKPARDLALRYRVAMQDWVNRASPFPHPPTLEVQQLPSVRSETLKRYFKLFERLHSREMNYQAPDTSEGADKRLRGVGKPREFARHVIESGESGAVKSIEINQPRENIEAILSEYINRSEENALEVLVYIFGIEDDDLVCKYATLIFVCVKRLAGNIHLIRSLFNLYDENAYQEKPVHRISGACNSLVLVALIEAGVIQKYEQDENITVDFTEPRDFQYQHHTHTEHRPDGGNTKTDIRMKIPSNYLPLHWNGTRLVNPCLNPSYQEFSEILKKDATQNVQRKIDETKKYVDEIDKKRRYALDFSRMKVTEIPGTENMDIWFNYYQDEDMEPDEMQAEVMVNDASIIYHIKNGVCYMRPQGNILPRLSGEPEEDHIDGLYGKADVQQWTSPEAQNNLSYYLLKYAHALLVLPRSVGKQPKSSSVEAENKFNLRLREHSTETYMPNGQGGTGRRVTVHHYRTAFSTVTGHKRKLPEGRRPSPEAIAEAERNHIDLQPGETYVKTHTRGSEETEQGRNGKGINI